MTTAADGDKRKDTELQWRALGPRDFANATHDLIHPKQSMCATSHFDFPHPVRKSYITKDVFANVKSTNTTGKLSENEPANTSANVFVSTQLRTDSCCRPKHEKTVVDFHVGRQRVTASSEVDCSSMYAVAPMWTYCVGRENGVAAFST